MTSTHLALTIGDATGIGPEITAKALAVMATRHPECRLTVIGDIAALDRAASQLDLRYTSAVQTIDTIDTMANSIGETSYAAIQTATLGCLNGDFDALVTGPISKKQLHAAGIHQNGHTEILETLCREHHPHLKAIKADMLFVYQQLRMLLLTRHIPLATVGQALSSDDIMHSLTSLQMHCQSQSEQSPRIAVMGLNPHAGEIGGHEEHTILTPVIQQLNAQNRLTDAPIFFGPLAADALMRDFNPIHPAYDAYVACYHDQGLIPMKLLGGYETVNVTIGLPMIRTSVSHGTAEDIAGKGIANEGSLLAAIDEALKLTEQQVSLKLSVLKV